MGKAWRVALACFSRPRPSPERSRPCRDGTAIAEATMADAEASTPERMQPGASSSGHHHLELQQHKRPSMSREGLSTPSASTKPPVRWGSLERREDSDSTPPAMVLGSPNSVLRAALGGGRVGSTSVRFAQAPVVSSLKRAGSREREPRLSRVRVQGAEAEEGGRPDSASAAPSETGTGVGTSRNNSNTSAHGGGGGGGGTAKADGAESRALTQLVSKLISHDINYRQEFESIMDTFGATFPKSCLENFFEQHEIHLPNNRQLMILTLYQAGEDSDKIDGVALLKDLDRAAFKRFAMANGGKPLAADAGGKRNSVTSVQRSDKSRILTLVSTQLNRDKSFSINAGGDELTDAQHIQEMIEQIDLNNILIPIGTRAKYVSATDDPESFQVPVWSLRAMHKRKQERERFLIGNDPDFKKLGQTGRDALRKRLARRSMFQQQEIIANAVVAAARAAVEPSVRRVENSIHSAAPSRCGSFTQSRSGSLRRHGSDDDVSIRGGGGGRPRSAAPPKAPGMGMMGGGGIRPMSAMPPRGPPPPSGVPPPVPLGAGVGVGAAGGLLVSPVTVPATLAARRPSGGATQHRPVPMLFNIHGDGAQQDAVAASQPHPPAASPQHLSSPVVDMNSAEAAIQRLMAKSLASSSPATAPAPAPAAAASPPPPPRPPLHPQTSQPRHSPRQSDDAAVDVAWDEGYPPMSPPSSLSKSVSRASRTGGGGSPLPVSAVRGSSPAQAASPVRLGSPGPGPTSRGVSPPRGVAGAGGGGGAAATPRSPRASASEYALAGQRTFVDSHTLYSGGPSKRALIGSPGGAASIAGTRPPPLPAPPGSPPVGALHPHPRAPLQSRIADGDGPSSGSGGGSSGGGTAAPGDVDSPRTVEPMLPGQCQAPPRSPRPRTSGSSSSQPQSPLPVDSHARLCDPHSQAALHEEAPR